MASCAPFAAGAAARPRTPDSGSVMPILSALPAPPEPPQAATTMAAAATRHAHSRELHELLLQFPSHAPGRTRWPDAASGPLLWREASGSARRWRRNAGRGTNRPTARRREAMPYDRRRRRGCKVAMRTCPTRQSRSGTASASAVSLALPDSRFAARRGAATDRQSDGCLRRAFAARGRDHGVEYLIRQARITDIDRLAAISRASMPASGRRLARRRGPASPACLPAERERARRRGAPGDRGRGAPRRSVRRSPPAATSGRSTCWSSPRTTMRIA